ncbi:MAG: heme ABC transporter permease, partial [Moraxella sp.]|nr:heme ABC transporter permease [Moraxella sp.]
PPSMWMPLLIMILGGYFLVAALAIYRTNTLLLARDEGKEWVNRIVKRGL